MREAVRRQYLKAMGIPVWMPRQDVPFGPQSRLLAAQQSMQPANEAQHNPVDVKPSGGKPTHAGHLLEAADELAHLRQVRHEHEVDVSAVDLKADALSQGPSSQGPSSQGPSSQRQGRGSIESDSRPSPLADTLSATQPSSDSGASQAPAPVDLTPPRFELHFLRVGLKGVWVCDQPHQMDSMRRFARRVAAAMAMPLDPNMSVPSFRWPFIEQGTEDQSAAVAEQALRAQWKFLQSQGVQYVVAFGEQPQQWLQKLSISGYFSSESLDSWLLQPNSKPELWRSLIDLQQTHETL